MVGFVNFYSYSFDSIMVEPSAKYIKLHKTILYIQTAASNDSPVLKVNVKVGNTLTYSRLIKLYRIVSYRIVS